MISGLRHAGNSRQESSGRFAREDPQQFCFRGRPSLLQLAG